MAKKKSTGQKDHCAVMLGKLRAHKEAGPKKAKAHKVDKTPCAVDLGRKGGKQGGPARAKALPKKRRVEIASMGAKAKHKK